MDARRVIDECRPMLADFFVDIGLLQPGELLEFSRLLEPFSNWLDSQEISEEARFYLASRLGGFICEYLIEVCKAQRVIENDRIFIRVPIDEALLRQFDPYTVAIGMVTNRSSLKEFLGVLCS